MKPARRKVDRDLSDKLEGLVKSFTNISDHGMTYTNDNTEITQCLHQHNTKLHEYEGMDHWIAEQTVKRARIASLGPT